MLAFITVLIACNSDDSTANNSTTADSTANYTTPMADSNVAGTVDPAAGTTNASTTTKPARKGRATASIKADDASVKMEMDRAGYYNRTEIAPAYQGSIEDYVTDNIEYPQNAIDNSAEGTVYVQFGVDRNGNISNVSTVGTKIGYGLEEEAIRVVSKMPKWTPGKVKGKNVNTWRTLPITYKLES